MTELSQNQQRDRLLLNRTLRRALTLSAAALFLLIALPSETQATEIVPGITHTFKIAEQDEETLLEAFTLVVFPGTTDVTIEVETDDDAHDIDLFVRFGLSPANQNGSILADYSSATPGSGEEMIEADESSDPPLQTGIYRISFLVKTLDIEITGTIKATLETGGDPTTFIISTFSSLDDEGWTRNFPVSDIPGASLGDFGAIATVEPGGFLRYFESAGERQDFAVAPPKFLGDLSLLTNARFEFDYRHSSDFGPLIKVSMRLLGADSAYRWVGDVPPNHTWMHYVVELTEGEWTQSLGAAGFAEVLQDLQRIELSVDQSPGRETNDLDNFALIGGPADAPGGAPDSPRSSTFEFGLDGWTRNYPPAGIPGSSIGSIDSAITLDGPGARDSRGFLKFVDSGDRGEDFAVAPAKFLGDLSGLDRPWFEFHYRHIEGEFPRSGVSVRIIGMGTVYVWVGPRPRSTWQRVAFPLNENNLVLMEGEAAFEQVLANVERIEVSMDVSEGPEVNGLDNFQLLTEYVSPSGRALFVEPENVVISGVAGDPSIPGPTLDVTGTATPVDWVASVQPSSVEWLRLSQTIGTTPSQITLTVDASDLPPGRYEAELLVKDAEFLNPRKVVRVTLVLTESQTRPRITGIGHSAARGLALSGGVLATVFGENFAPAEQVVGFEEGTTNLLREALGVRILVNDAGGALIEAAPLLYVGPRQVNFQMPFSVAGRASVRVVVMSGDEMSQPADVAISATGPGIFTFGANRAAVVNEDGTLNTTAQPAERSSVVLTFLSGAGELDPPISSGMATPEDPLSFPTAPVRAMIGGREARVIATVMTPGFVGLTQAAIEIPADLVPGDHELFITIGERTSNGGLVSVQ